MRPSLIFTRGSFDALQVWYILVMQDNIHTYKLYKYRTNLYRSFAVSLLEEGRECATSQLRYASSPHVRNLQRLVCTPAKELFSPSLVLTYCSLDPQ